MRTVLLQGPAVTTVTVLSWVDVLAGLKADDSYS